jgi:hypothetical protein
MRRVIPPTVLLVAVATLVATARQGPMAEWPVYGGDPGGTKMSPLSDINHANVSRLAVAWEWQPGDEPLEEFGTRPGNFQNTPLMIDNVLYVSMPKPGGRSGPSTRRRMSMGSHRMGRGTSTEVWPPGATSVMATSCASSSTRATG